LFSVSDGRRQQQQLAGGSQLSILVPEADEGDAAPLENVHKWRMVISYDGTKFKGSFRPPFFYAED
jgi:tRNA pseudouridine38-40 synthase